jgi:alpha-1,6-mannosyltransferase
MSRQPETRPTAPVPRDLTTRCLVGAAAVLALAFAGMAWLGDLYEHARGFVLLFVVASVAYAGAVLAVVRQATDRRSVRAILAAGILFRLILLPTTPSLSTDVYRYAWDGRLALAGMSPYRHPPNAPELASFRDRVLYPRLNHPDWLTVYPPGAQFLFAGIAWLKPGSVAPFKVAMLAFDLLALALLLGWLRAVGRPAAWALIYAWHPLAIVELAGGAHVDAVILVTSVGALWAASRGRRSWAGALVGLGALVKLYPLLLLFAVMRRRPWREAGACAIVILAGYGLFLREGPAVLGSLFRYVADEEFNPALRGLLELALAPFGPAARGAARVLALGALGAVAVGIAWSGRERPPAERARTLVGAWLLLTPSLFPWYPLWLLPILAAAPAWPWLYLSCAVALTYLVFADPVWRIPPWVVAVEFAPVAVGLLLDGLRRPRGVRHPPL